MKENSGRGEFKYDKVRTVSATMYPHPAQLKKK
jgi:hypothetical protein